jgi:hypothetical protein
MKATEGKRRQMTAKQTEREKEETQGGKYKNCKKMTKGKFRLRKQRKKENKRKENRREGNVSEEKKEK